MRSSTRMFAALALTAGLVWGQPNAWRKSTQLEVVAPAKKANGLAWDAEVPVIIPIPGSPMPTIGNPTPDMMIYLVDAEGETYALTQRANGARTRAIHPAAPCPNSSLCSYNGVPLPQDYVGVLILDLDLKQHDFMMAGIIQIQAQEDPAKEHQIEEELHKLMDEFRKAGSIGGAPALGSELPTSTLLQCSSKEGCFGDALAGQPSLKFAVASAKPTGPVRRCGMAMEGAATVQVTGPKEVDVAYDFTTNACKAPARAMVAWDFGDGTYQVVEPNVAITHTYEAAGQFTVTATPQCMREISTCSAPPSKKIVMVK